MGCQRRKPMIRLIKQYQKILRIQFVKELGGFSKDGLSNAPEHHSGGLIVVQEPMMWCGLHRNTNISGGEPSYPQKSWTTTGTSSASPTARWTTTRGSTLSRLSWPTQDKRVAVRLDTSWKDSVSCFLTWNYQLLCLKLINKKPSYKKVKLEKSEN